MGFWGGWDGGVSHGEAGAADWIDALTAHRGTRLKWEPAGQGRIPLRNRSSTEAELAGGEQLLGAAMHIAFDACDRRGPRGCGGT